VTRRIAAIWLAVCATCTASCLGISPVAAQVRVSVGMASGVNELTSLVASEKGFFAEEGLAIDRKPIARGNLAVEAIASGSMQFAEVSDVVFFSAVTHGIPLIALGDGSRGFTGKMIAAPDHRPVKTLADMKGDHIGLQVGTGLQGVFLMLLEKQGLAESDFKISNVRVVDMPAAMASSPPAFDAVLGWDPMMTRIVEAGKGKEVISAQQFQQMAGITYPLLLVAAKPYIDANHDTVQHFVNAYAKAQKYIREHPDDALRIYSAAVHKAGANLDETVIKKMLFEVPKFVGVNIIPSDWTELTHSRDFLFKTGQIQSKPDLKTIIDPSFGDAAEASIK
jgi:ABC-type nitrate/sulfonate/bicarbonate transport system substrate-binding protein